MLLVKIDSPRIVVPKTKILIKKDFTSKENRVEFYVEVYEPVSKVVSSLSSNE